MGLEWVVDGCRGSKRKGERKTMTSNQNFVPLALLRADGRNRWKVSSGSLWNAVEGLRRLLVQNGNPRYSPPASRLARPAYRCIGLVLSPPSLSTSVMGSSPGLEGPPATLH